MTFNLLHFRSIYLLLICLAFVQACTSVEVSQRGDSPVKSSVKPPEAAESKKGVYHKVTSGETLWRIAKTYGISILEITNANGIPNAAQIEKDQLLFIPGALETKLVEVDISVQESTFVWPVEGEIITFFRELKNGQVYKGIDIQTNPGAAVVASRDGLVVFSDFLPGYGQTVIIDHQDGYFSVYAHNAELLVQLNEIVKQRDKVARVAGSHDLAFLHFQLRKHSIEDNPLYYLP